MSSIDHIMKAVTKIEELMSDRMNIKDSPWYKYDKGLKAAVDKKLADIKTSNHKVIYSHHNGNRVCKF